MTLGKSLAVASIAIAFVCQSSRADEPDTRRQVYSDGQRINIWLPVDSGRYYKILWHFGSRENGEWQAHEVYWFPNDPDNFYFYNTTTKTFWGRCTKGWFPVVSRRPSPSLQQQFTEYAYTILPYWVKPGLGDLNTVNFDLYPMGKMPPIPESTDGTAVEPPPTPTVLALVPIAPAPAPPPNLPMK
jgi:hypothetical protein